MTDNVLCLMGADRTVTQSPPYRNLQSDDRRLNILLHQSGKMCEYVAVGPHNCLEISVCVCGGDCSPGCGTFEPVEEMELRSRQGQDHGRSPAARTVNFILWTRDGRAWSSDYTSILPPIFFRVLL